MMLLVGVIVAMAVIPVNNTETLFQTTETRTGPEDGPNQPFGEAKGINPVRVVCVWNPEATNQKFQHNDPVKGDFFANPENNNGTVQGKMFRDGVLKPHGVAGVSLIAKLNFGNI